MFKVILKNIGTDDAKSNTALKAAKKLRRDYPGAVMVGDLGSGHVRFAIIDPASGKTLSKCKKNVHLAEGTYSGQRRPKPENVLSLRAELHRLSPILDLFGIQVRLVGTSAMRFMGQTQEGRRQILDLEETAGHPIHVISGRAEAKYNLNALRHEFPKLQHHDPVATGKVIAFAALGGGSMQMGEFDNGYTNKLISIPYGIETLKAETQNDVKKVKTAVNKGLAETRFDRIDTLYASGGGWRDVDEIINAIRSDKLPDMRPYAHRMTYSQFKRNAAMIAALSEGKFNKYDAKTRTLQEIQIAAEALVAVMERFGIKEVIISKATMRQAVAYDDDWPPKDARLSHSSEERRSSSGEPIGPTRHASGQAQDYRKALSASHA